MDQNQQLETYKDLSKKMNSHKVIVQKIQAIIENQDLSLISENMHLIRLGILKVAREKYGATKREFTSFVDDLEIPQLWTGIL